MNKEDQILRLLQYMQKEGIIVTKECKKDIQELVQTDIAKFASQIFKDFSRKNYEHYNRFEKLKLTPKQRIDIGNRILWRYEYRNTSNFRCIFVVETEYNTGVTILICAFNEDGNKKSGKNSYNYNIDRAINIIQKIFKGGLEDEF